MPASVEGLTYMTEYFQTNSEQNLSENIPDSIDTFSGFLKSMDYTLENRDFERTAQRLEEVLPEPVFHWVCACAVYPELSWGLTMHLGSLLSTADHTLVTEDNVFYLIRLPWFRKGKLPDMLRIELLKKLPSEKQNKVRDGIIQLMEKSQVEPGSYAEEDFKLNLAVQKLILKGRKDKGFTGWIKEIKEHTMNRTVQDYVLIEFLNSRMVSPLTFKLPKTIKNFQREVRLPYINPRFACFYLLLEKKPGDATKGRGDQWTVLFT